MQIEEKVYVCALTLISSAIIFLAWGYDAPMGNFSLVFGGMLLGHIITEVLNFKGDDE